MNQTNLNATIEIDYLKQYLIKFTAFNGYYTIPIIGGIGLVLNLICCLVFLSPKFKQKKQFKFVIMNVFVESIMSGGLIGFNNNLCFQDCIIFNTYSTQFLKAFILSFVGNGLYVFTGMNEIFLTYDRYIMLKSKNNWFNKADHFKYIMTAAFSFSFIIFVPTLFAYDIKPANNKTDLYYVDFSSFGNTDAFQLYVLINFVLSNSITILFLVILSILVIKEFKIYIKKSNETQVEKNGDIIQLENDCQVIVYRDMNSNKHGHSKRQKLNEINFIRITLTLNLCYLTMRIVNMLSASLYRSDILNNIKYKPSTVIIRNACFIVVACVLAVNIVILASFNSIFKNSLKNKTVAVRPIPTKEGY